MKNTTDKKNASLVFGFDDIKNEKPIIQDANKKQRTDDSTVKKEAINHTVDNNESKTKNTSTDSITSLLSDNLKIKENYSEKWNIFLKYGIKPSNKK